MEIRGRIKANLAARVDNQCIVRVQTRRRYVYPASRTITDLPGTLGRVIVVGAGNGNKAERRRTIAAVSDCCLVVGGIRIIASKQRGEHLARASLIFVRHVYSNGTARGVRLIIDRVDRDVGSLGVFFGTPRTCIAIVVQRHRNLIGTMKICTGCVDQSVKRSVDFRFTAGDGQSRGVIARKRGTRACGRRDRTMLNVNGGDHIGAEIIRIGNRKVITFAAVE